MPPPPFEQCELTCQKLEGPWPPPALLVGLKKAMKNSLHSIYYAGLLLRLSSHMKLFLETTKYLFGFVVHEEFFSL